MSKLSVFVMVALVLGGAGTGMGGVLIYQFATGTLVGSSGPPGEQGIPGLPGTNGTDGTDGIDGSPGPQQLSGVYEGDQVWSTAIVPANETVTLRNGNFYGIALYVYGNLTLEQANLYLEICPLGNSNTLFNSSRWLGTPTEPNGWVFSILAKENASVTFLNDVGFILPGVLYFRVYAADQSAIIFENVSYVQGFLYAYDSAKVYLKNTRTAITLNTYNDASVYAWDSTFTQELKAYQTASVFTNDSILEGNFWFKFYGNSTYQAWNTTRTALGGVELNENSTATLWNSTLAYVNIYLNASALISTNSYIPEMNTWDSAVATVRASSTINTLNAHQVSITYLYLSESCVINTQNLYDAAQVISL